MPTGNAIFSFSTESEEDIVDSAESTDGIEQEFKSNGSFVADLHTNGKVVMDMQALPTSMLPMPIHFTESQIPLVELGETSPPVTPTVSSPTNISTITEPCCVHREETSRALIVQIVVTLLVAGVGTVSAGLLLDRVQNWKVYQNVSEMIIMVPPLLGLKGNLEMTLASRLSTLAHLGVLSQHKKRWHSFAGEVALTKAQSVVFAFFAALVAVFVGAIYTQQLKFSNFLLLCASGMAAAFGASLFLGILIVSVILISQRYKLNPDNVATPVVASFGDLLSLAKQNDYDLTYRTLSIFSSVGLGLNADSSKVSAGAIAFFVIMCPIFGFIAWKIPSAKAAMLHGWKAILVALLISSCGGFILQIALDNYPSMAPYQPVINGVGGNLACILASRLSTDCHRLGDTLTSGHFCVNPIKGFFGSSGNARTARILLLVVLPSQTIFMLIIHYVASLFGNKDKLTVGLAIAYLAASFLQVLLLLIITFWSIPTLWKFRIDPDNSAIPIITALGDVLGTGLLTAGYFIVSVI